MIIAFCGHSDFVASEGSRQIVLDILEKKAGNACAELYLGGYGNFDRFAYSCCKQYKENHPHVRLILITPYISERYQKNRLQYEKERYDDIVYPALEGVPPRFAIPRRNRWMADAADIVIVAVTRRYGGAYSMLEYAKRKGKQIYNIFEDGAREHA